MQISKWQDWFIWREPDLCGFSELWSVEEGMKLHSKLNLLILARLVIITFDLRLYLQDSHLYFSLFYLVEINFSCIPLPVFHLFWEEIFSLHMVRMFNIVTPFLFTLFKIWIFLSASKQFFLSWSIEEMLFFWMMKGMNI